MNGIKNNTCLQALCLYILFVIVGCGNKSDKPLSNEQVIDFIKDKQHLDYSLFRNWNVSNREGNPNLFVLDYLPQTTDSVWFRYIIRNTELGLQINGPQDSTFIGLNLFQPLDSTVTLREILKVKEIFQLTGSEVVRNIEDKKGLMIKYPKFTLIFWNAPNDSLKRKYSMYQSFNEHWTYYIN
jgi:hypothetical protein